MQTIAQQKSRSTRTISEHVRAHNEAVKRSGFCPNCKRTNSQHFNREVVRGAKEQESARGRRLFHKS